MTHIVNGWISTAYDGDDLSRVEMAVGEREPGEWHPAFLDWEDHQRVARIRVPLSALRSERGMRVWLRVNGEVRTAGTLGRVR